MRQLSSSILAPSLMCVSSLFCFSGMKNSNAQALAELLGLISHDVAQGFVQGATGKDDLTEWLLGDGKKYGGILSESMDDIIDKIIGKDYNSFNDWLLGTGSKDGALDKMMDSVVSSIIGDDYDSISDFLMGNNAKPGLLKEVNKSISEIINLSIKSIDGLVDPLLSAIPNTLGQMLLEAFNGIALMNPGTWNERFLSQMDTLGNTKFRDALRDWNSYGCSSNPESCNYKVSFEYGVYSPAIEQKKTTS